MKTKKLVYVSILLLFVASILSAEDFKKEIPVEDAMKVFCGTWINTGWGTEKDIYNNDGTYEWYWQKADANPAYKGTFKIEKAWMDGEGNIWFTVWRSYQGNSWALSKVSNSGTILEYTRYFDADNPPSKIVQDGDYFKYIINKTE